MSMWQILAVGLVIGVLAVLVLAMLACVALSGRISREEERDKTRGRR